MSQKKCALCGGVSEECIFSAGSASSLQVHTKGGFLKTVTDKVDCYCCTTCGHIDFYAQTPSKMKQ